MYAIFYSIKHTVSLVKTKRNVMCYYPLCRYKRDNKLRPLLIIRTTCTVFLRRTYSDGFIEVYRKPICVLLVSSGRTLQTLDKGFFFLIEDQITIFIRHGFSFTFVSKILEYQWIYDYRNIHT